MIKCFIFKGIPIWCSFVETKWFWSTEAAERYVISECPTKWGQGKYFYIKAK